MKFFSINKKRAGVVAALMLTVVLAALSSFCLAFKERANAAEGEAEEVYVSVASADGYVRNGSNAAKTYSFEEIGSAHGAKYVGLGYKALNVKYKSSAEIRTLMKFALPSKAEADEKGIDRYLLSVGVFKNADYLSGDQRYIFCFTTDVDWQESSLTWNNMPSSVVRGSENVLGVLEIKQGEEYENKPQSEKKVTLDVSESIAALVDAGAGEITVFCYAENPLETSLMLHSRESSAEDMRARIVGMKENVTNATLAALIERAEGLDEKLYTASTYAALSGALSRARAAEGRLEVIRAYRALEDALDALLLKAEDDLARGKPVRSNLNKTAAAKVTDGDENTYWSGKFYPAYLDVDLGDSYALDKATVVFPDGKAVLFSLYGSLNGKDYDRIYRTRTETSGSADITFDTPVPLRILRVYLEYTAGEDSAYLAEVKAFGALIGGNGGTIRDGSFEKITGITSFEKSAYAAPITEAETIENVFGIVERTVGAKYRDFFSFALVRSDADFFSLEDEAGKVKITGNSGLSLAVGLNYYYKNFLNVHVSEQTIQGKMPESVVKVGSKIVKNTDFSVRYAFNYCTMSYTFAFFDEQAWQRENDFLALSGVNLVLDLAGQEATWIYFLMRYGYSYDDAKDWLTGPAYAAWQFMDNMEVFGGPLPDGYIADRVELARSSQRWKRSLGINTVLQGYAGMVPTDFNKFYTSATIIDQGGWNGFSRPAMIATDGALYDKLAADFYECQKYIYGADEHYYAVDPFHEGGKRPQGLSDVAVAENVLQSLLRYDPQGVWVVQGWQSNPTAALLEGMGDKRNTNVLIVDLIKYPISSGKKYDKTSYGSTTLKEKEFGGTDWVWGLLASFGGNPSMHGELDNMVDDIMYAKKNSRHMKGIGIISEATFDNPVVYDLIFDLVWADADFDLGDWLNGYISRRYGGTSRNVREAWNIMRSANYDHGVRFTAEVYGTKNKTPQDYKSQSISYGADKTEAALRLLLADFDTFKGSECYLYDLSELMRQVVSNYSTVVYNDVLAAKAASDASAFSEAKTKFLRSLEVLNAVAATQKDMLGGEWIGRASDMGERYDDFSVDAFTMNAKALITTWGSRSSNRSLKDYGWRNYEGIFADVYARNWRVYLDSVEKNLTTGAAIATKNINGYFDDVYWKWVLADTDYTRTAKDSPEEIAAVAAVVLAECMLGEAGNDANSGDLALYRTVTVDGNSAKYAAITDGDDETYVSLDGGQVKLTVDLIAEFELSALKVKFTGGVHRFSLSVSDGSTVKEIGQFDSSADGSAEVALSAAGRLLEFTFDVEQSPAAIAEIRAYGERLLPSGEQLKRLTDFCDGLSPVGSTADKKTFASALADAKRAVAEDAPPDEVNGVYWALYDAVAVFDLSRRANLALGRPVSAHNGTSGSPDRLVDGSTDTAWDGGRLSPPGVAYQEQITPGFVEVELAAPYYIDSVKVIFGSTSIWYCYEIYVGSGGEWTLVAEKKDHTVAGADGDSYSFKPVRGDRVKLIATDIQTESSGKRSPYHLRELEVYGEENLPVPKAKKDLAAYITACEAYNASDYEAEAFAAFTRELETARAVLADETADESDYINAHNALREAVDTLSGSQLPPSPKPGDGNGGDDGNSLSPGAIAGIAVAAVAVAGGAAAAAAVVLKKKKSKPDKKEAGKEEKDEE